MHDACRERARVFFGVADVLTRSRSAEKSNSKPSSANGVTSETGRDCSFITGVAGHASRPNSENNDASGVWPRGKTGANADSSQRRDEKETHEIIEEGVALLDDGGCAGRRCEVPGAERLGELHVALEVDGGRGCRA